MYVCDPCMMNPKIGTSDANWHLMRKPWASVVDDTLSLIDPWTVLFSLYYEVQFPPLLNVTRN